MLFELQKGGRRFLGSAEERNREAIDRWGRCIMEKVYALRWTAPRARRLRRDALRVQNEELRRWEYIDEGNPLCCFVFSLLTYVALSIDIDCVALKTSHTGTL